MQYNKAEGFYLAASFYEVVEVGRRALNYLRYILENESLYITWLGF